MNNWVAVLASTVGFNLIMTWVFFAGMRLSSLSAAEGLPGLLFGLLFREQGIWAVSTAVVIASWLIFFFAAKFVSYIIPLQCVTASIVGLTLVLRLCGL